MTVDICLDVLRILSNGSDLTGVAKKYGVKRTSIARLLKKNGFLYTVRSRPRPRGVFDYALTDIQKQVLLGDLFDDGAQSC